MAAFTKLEVKLISHATKPQVHAKLSNEIPKKKAKQRKKVQNPLYESTKQ